MTVTRLVRAAAAVALAATTVAAAPPSVTGGESAASTYFTSIRHQPSLLLAFLADMPKGGDLHNHLSGAVYAESYLRWAAADGLCLSTATMSIVSGACDGNAGRPPVADVVRGSNPLFDRAIDAFSMRHWDRSLNGHDHFFATFNRFGPASLKFGDMLAEVSSRAAAEHVSYLELMVTPDSGRSVALGTAAGWNPDLPAFRRDLLDKGLGREIVALVKARLDAAEARERELLRCGSAAADPGCRVTVRYIFQVGRSGEPEAVFAQILAAFETIAADPRVVSLNLVQPEDNPVAVRDFRLQMSMLDYLHGVYPSVKITLHAGELTEGLVAPETLRFHMRESVRVGHASRLGHGTGVMYEDDPIALLRELAAKKVLVEVALSSSDLILGVRGSRHPLQAYLKYGVPIALVTDDAGVSRSTLTLEYRKAVDDQSLDYPALKRVARNSIAYCFADQATRTRLMHELDADFAAFESRQPRLSRPRDVQ
jgi:adenosine deaminase